MIAVASFARANKGRSQNFYDSSREIVCRFRSLFFTGMEHSSLDLSIVKKEPGFDEPFSSGSNIFDTMMSDHFHDTSLHSMVCSPAR